MPQGAFWRYKPLALDSACRTATEQRRQRREDPSSLVQLPILINPPTAPYHPSLSLHDAPSGKGVRIEGNLCLLNSLPRPNLPLVEEELEEV